MMISRKRALAGFGVALFGSGLLGVVGACGGGNEAGSASKLPAGVRAEGMEHEACDERGRTDAVDVDRDGKPDIRRVYDQGGREVCRVTDLNHDGKPDMFEYYDASGQLRRREADFDDSGVVDLIEYYQDGKLIRKELDTTGQHRIDTWDYYDPASGKLSRRERDTNHDGRVDQWWTYDGDKITIAVDKNGDDKPDPEHTIVLGGGEAKDAGVAHLEPDATAPPSAADAGPAPVVPAGPAAGPAISVSDAGAPEAGPPKRKENRGGAKK
jgi:hypothetical protein